MRPFVPVRGCRCLGCRPEAYNLCGRCWGRKEGAFTRCRCDKEKD